MHEYDEFGLLDQNAREAGLRRPVRPVVSRHDVVVGRGQRLSTLLWGETTPELVLLHGGAQNAHTWDTVALALNRPLLAIDLPGHGHSDGRSDRDYWPWSNAEAIAPVIGQLAPQAAAVVGMSLGGLTAIRLAAVHPRLVRRLAAVDVTPGVTLAKSAPIAEFVQGPDSFASFDELLTRTAQYTPTARCPRCGAGRCTTPGSCPTAPGRGDTGSARPTACWISPRCGTTSRR